jgi:hypothetical protein
MLTLWDDVCYGSTHKTMYQENMYIHHISKHNNNNEISFNQNPKPKPELQPHFL